MKRKARACMKKGVNIHVMVSAAHSGWSSTKVKKVAKSVDTSKRLKNALTNANLSTFSILGMGRIVINVKCFTSRLPCYVFCICLLTNKDQKYKSVELGHQLISYCL